MSTMFDVATFTAAEPGPRLLVLGAVHGNEVCGALAIRRVLAELNSGALRIARGQATFVPVTNRLAFERGTRNGDRNLNRNLAPTESPRDNEDRIANELCPLLARNDVLLDLHSFHSPGIPFVMLGPENNDGTLQPFKLAEKEEALACRLGVRRAVDGWLETYASGVARRGGAVKYGIGTTEFMRAAGGYGVTLECGQHEDPNAPEVAYAAIRRALAHLGLVPGPRPAGPEDMEVLRLAEVIDRAEAGDTFVRDWHSFDRVRQGDPVGRRGDGAPIRAGRDGFIVFPNARAEVGNEWFYFAEACSRRGLGTR